MRNFVRYLLQALVLVVVFLFSAMTAMRFAIHGREVTIPKLIGMAPQDAEVVTNKLGLVLQRDTRYFSTTVPAGKIMSQTPAEGEKVRRGWRVRVAESMGPQSVVIPDVNGESERAAELNIRRRGLDVGTVAMLNVPGAVSGTVVAQSPPPNATGVVSPKVSLLIGNGEMPVMYVVPDLTGLPLDSVTRIVTDSGFKVGNIQTVAAANPGQSGRGGATVVRHEPSVGQRIAAGSAINLEVAR